MRYNYPKEAALSADGLNRLNMIAGLPQNPGISGQINPDARLSTGTAPNPPIAGSSMSDAAKKQRAIALRGGSEGGVKGAAWIAHLEKIAAVSPKATKGTSTAGNKRRGPSAVGSPVSSRLTKLRQFLGQSRPGTPAATPTRSAPSIGSIGNDVESLARSYLGQAAGSGADFFNEVARRRDSILSSIEGGVNRATAPIGDVANRIGQGAEVVGNFGRDTYNLGSDAVSQLRNIAGI